jgi:hypothetical protein
MWRSVCRAAKLGLRRKNESIIEAGSISILRSVKGCAVLNKIKSHFIPKECNAYSVNNGIDDCRRKRLNHLEKWEVI